MSNFNNFRWHIEEQNEFYAQSLGNKNKIFILGSSEVQPINATHVMQSISKDDTVYNLGIGGDLLKNRLNSLDLIIKHKPKLVLYGIGFRDFMKFDQKPSYVLFNNDSIHDAYLPNIHKLIEKEVLAKIGFYDVDFEFLNNPNEVTQHLTRELFKNPKNGDTAEYNFIIFPNTPFYKPTLSEFEKAIKSTSEKEEGGGMSVLKTLNLFLVIKI